MPAVAILDASEEMIRQAKQKRNLRITQVDIAKFVKPILPGQSVRIEMIRASDNQWILDWKEPEEHGELLASLRLQFSGAH